MLLGHDLLVKWLKLSHLVHEGAFVSRDCELLLEEPLQLREPVLGGSALFSILSALLVHILRLSQSIVQLLLAVVELSFPLAHLAFDF